MDLGPQFSTNPHHNIRFALWNAQSVKSKDTLLQQYLISAQLDVCLLMETWIKDCDSDWLDTTDLCCKGFEAKFINRKTKRGGGVGIVFDKSLKCVEVQRDKFVPTTFEHGSWRIIKGNVCLKFEVFYRPLGTKNVPISHFTDEFATFIERNRILDGNVILLGDFSVHVNNPNDVDALDFMATTEALGLQQHVNCATHNKGHTLDLILKEPEP